MSSHLVQLLGGRAAERKRHPDAVRGHEGPRSRARRGEAEDPQAYQGLAHDVPAHAEIPRELNLGREAIPDSELAGLDHLDQLAPDGVRGAVLGDTDEVEPARRLSKVGSASFRFFLTTALSIEAVVV